MSSDFKFGRVYPIDISGHKDWPIEAGEARQMCRGMQFAAAAALAAMDHAGLAGDEARLERTGVIAATGAGPRSVDLDSKISRQLVEDGDWQARLNALLYRNLRPSLFLTQLPNMFAANVSILLKTKGPAIAVAGGHAAGINAFHLAVELMTEGNVDVMLVCSGFDAQRYEMLLALASDAYLSPDIDTEDRRPVNSWSKDADGTILGDCGACIVLETLSHATNRGAPIIAALRVPLLSNSYFQRTDHSLGEILSDLPISDGLLPVIGLGAGDPHSDDAELELVESLASSCPAKNVRLTSATPKLGNSIEAALLVNTILAAEVLRTGILFPVSECLKAKREIKTFEPVEHESVNQFGGSVALVCGLNGDHSMVALVKAPAR